MKPVVVSSNQGRKMFVLGSEVTLKLTGAEADGRYFVFEAVTPPGMGAPMHVHRHEDEVVCVLDGEFEFQLDRLTQRGTAGAVVNLPTGVPHAFRNLGTRPGRTLWTITPGANFERFFEELSALPADRPPEMEAVTRIFGKYEIKILPQ